MYFDRFDICEAWYLYLNSHHAGQGSHEYARLSKLTDTFSPRSSLRSACDLSPNGLEIYLQLIDYPHNIVDDAGEGGQLFEMWAGAYGTTKVLIRADSFDSASELLLEWLDDHAPGLLTVIDYDAAARELGRANLADAEDHDALDTVIEFAETDMTVCSHTTLKNGNAIPSWEWGGDEVSLID